MWPKKEKGKVENGRRKVETSPKVNKHNRMTIKAENNDAGKILRPIVTNPADEEVYLIRKRLSLHD